MSYAGVETPAPEHEHRHCGNPEPHETHRTGTYWNPVICTGQVAALAPVPAASTGPAGEVLNPSAVGNPDETPIVQVSPALAAHFERTRCLGCGQINYTHADDCPVVGAPAGEAK